MIDTEKKGEYYAPTDTLEAHPEKLVPKPIFGVNALSWLHSKPAAPDRTDIFNLNEDNFGLKSVRNCVENKTFEMEVGFHFPATEWINHFYFEAKNNEKVFGLQHLGVGFPYLMKSIDSFDVCAPLFFWELHLEPHAQEVDKWIISRSEKHSIRPNFPLFHLIDFKYQTDYYRQVKNLCENRTLNIDTLTEITSGLCLLLQLEEQGLSLSNTPFPLGKRSHYADGCGRFAVVSGDRALAYRAGDAALA